MCLSSTRKFLDNQQRVHNRMTTNKTGFLVVVNQFGELGIFSVSDSVQFGSLFETNPIFTVPFKAKDGDNGVTLV